jgi:hypothetical protein
MMTTRDEIGRNELLEQLDGNVLITDVETGEQVVINLEHRAAVAALICPPAPAVAFTEGVTITLDRDHAELLRLELWHIIDRADTDPIRDIYGNDIQPNWAHALCKQLDRYLDAAQAQPGGEASAR